MMESELKTRLEEENWIARERELERDNMTEITLDDASLDYPKGRNSEKAPMFSNLVKKMSSSMMKFVASTTHILPPKDILILATFLGQPDSTVDITTHQVSQVIHFWRQTCVSIAKLACEPPTARYPRIHDLLRSHETYVLSTSESAKNAPKTDASYASPAVSVDTKCLSQIDAVGTKVGWMTSIAGMPLSVLQALCILSRSGSCDAYLESTDVIGKAGRMAYEVSELLHGYQLDLPQHLTQQAENGYASPLQHLAFPRDLVESLKQIDLNETAMIPLETVRAYLLRKDPELTNNQVTMIFWALCHTDKSEDVSEAASASASTAPAQSKHSVKTPFEGDTQKYMGSFADDVNKYLQSLPGVNVASMVGLLEKKIGSNSSQELVSNALKLDASSRTKKPAKTCLWMSKRVLKISDILAAIVSKDLFAEGGDMIVGVGNEYSFRALSQATNGTNHWLANLSTNVELDILMKYPEVCRKGYSVVPMGTVVESSTVEGGSSTTVSPVKMARGPDDDHWKVLTSRRLDRADRLTISWRNCMCSEWAQSLYDSKHERFLHRVSVVKKSVQVFHKQYDVLGRSIVRERKELVADKYPLVQKELRVLINEQHDILRYHMVFVSCVVQRFHRDYAELVNKAKDMLVAFFSHAGDNIKCQILYYLSFVFYRFI